MKRIVFISGLGANELAFSALGEFPLPTYCAEWIQEQDGESLQDYAVRFMAHHEIHTSDILVGLSFGGLLSQVIAQHNGNEHVILLSSFRDKNDLKNPFRLGLKWSLYKLSPASPTPYVDSWVAQFLNAGNKESRLVLEQMLQETDYGFMRWALGCIADHSAITSPRFTIYSLIGNKDLLVNLWPSPYRYVIEGGSHFMVYVHAEEVTEILNEIIHHITA